MLEAVWSDNACDLCKRPSNLLFAQADIHDAGAEVSEAPEEDLQLDSDLYYVCMYVCMSE